MIPTTDSTRSFYLTKTLLSNNMNVMSPGPTGTGKSLNLAKLLGGGLGEAY
jgi:dynein heavy chain